MSNSRLALFAGAILGVAPCGRIARADLIGVTWSSADVYRVDQSTGESERLFGLGGYTGSYIVGIDYGPDGMPYAVALDGNRHIDLYRLDLDGHSAERVLVEPNQFRITEGDIAFDPVSGLLYIIDAYRVDSPLLTVNIVSGEVAEVGALGVDRDFDSLSFDGDGRLWAIDHASYDLVEIDPATGSILSSLGIDGGGGTVGGMDWDYATGSMYVTPGGPRYADRLYTVDLESGHLTDIGFTRYGGFAGLAVIPVPSPASIGLVSVLLSGVATRRARRT